MDIRGGFHGYCGSGVGRAERSSEQFGRDRICRPQEDVLLAGKTGTAEIKDSKEDTTGTELGWFAVFSAGEDEENPILIVSMVEDVKERGGSGYVVEKVSQVLDVWFRKEYQGGKAAEGETP